MHTDTKHSSHDRGTVELGDAVSQPSHDEGVGMSVDLDKPLSVPDGKHCGCLGCDEEALWIIDHPQHGQIVVCSTHARSYEVVAHV